MSVITRVLKAIV